jgi:hypothetical protein
VTLRGCDVIGMMELTAGPTHQPQSVHTSSGGDRPWAYYVSQRAAAGVAHVCAQCLGRVGFVGPK